MFTIKPSSATKQASVPPPTSTKAKQAAPIGDDLTLEEDGLFTAKLISTAKQPKATAPPPVIPKTRQTAPADDLFAAPVDSGNVERELPQTSPDISSEPAKPQKKKPAGGGVDVFGGGGLDNKATIPPTMTATPSVEEKQETITTAAPVETKRSTGGTYISTIMNFYFVNIIIYLIHRRRSRTGWSGHGLTTFQQLKENVPGQHTVYKQCSI